MLGNASLFIRNTSAFFASPSLSRALGIAAAILLGGANLAQASTLVIGGPAQPVVGANCAPFGCYARYQQAYSASLFSGPITITGLTFYNTTYTPGTINPTTYTITLSSGGGTVGSLDSVFDNNVGANVETFFSGALSGAASPSFTITGNPFVYDPVSGDLLLDVTPASVNSGFGTVYNDARLGDFAGFQRVYSSGSNFSGQNSFSSDGWGLVTGFETEAATTPLPAALPLFASGLGVIGLLGWRRKRKRGAEA